MKNGYLANVVARLQQLFRENRAPLLIVLMTRCGVFLLAYLSLILLPYDKQPDITGFEWPWRGFPNNLLLDGWTRWDAGWYTHIAEQGYVDFVVGLEGQKNLAFPPLYPMLIRGFNFIFRDSMLSGIVISNLAFLGAALLLYQIVKARFGAGRASQTILLLSVYPFSFYFSAVYSEALFFLLVVAAFYFAEQEQWGVAALCAALGGATRLPGLALFPALGLYYLERIHFDLRKVRLNVLWLGLCVLGPVLYAVYLYVYFGDPLLNFKSARVPGWWVEGLNLELAAQTVAQLFSARNLLTGNYPAIFVFNLLMAGIFALSLIPVFRRQSIAYGIFSLLLIGSGVVQWLGLGRYVLAAFPVYIAWSSSLKNRVLFESVLIVSSLLLALLTIMYSHWFWVS